MRLLTFLLLSVCITNTSKAQLSIRNPQICHNQENYLACITDSEFLLTFANGEFLGLKTSDSLVKYSNQTKTITFLRKEFNPQMHFDTISISLLEKSILLKRGNEFLEIDSLSNLERLLYSYGVGNVTINGSIQGPAFSVGNTIFKITISTYSKRWAWDIRIEKEAKKILLTYNGFKNNRLSGIYFRDESVRYGFVVSTSFRTLKKIESVESLYTDTINTNGVTVRTNSIPLNENFYFKYLKSGKLKSVFKKGELKLCDCVTGF